MKTDNAHHTPEKVGIDSFLYACLEQEKTFKAIPYRLKGLERWPLVRESEEDPKQLAGKDARELLADMTQWYGSKFPETQEHGELTLKNIGAIATATVFVHHDISMIFNADQAETQPLPAWVAGETTPFWEMTFEALQKYFPHWSALMIHYFKWIYTEDAAEEPFEPGDLPPVGRFAPFFRRKPLGGASSSGGFSGRSDRGDRGPRESRGDGPRRGGDRDKRRDSGKFERGPRPERGGSRPERNPRPDRGTRPDRNGGDRDQETESKALSEVMEAISKLKSDPSLPEVRLKPTNSFYRRIQHQKAKDEGMNSISVGEGADRSLTIRRLDS